MAEINLESKMSKLYELKTQLERDLEDHKRLVKQYRTLIEVVQKSKRASDLPKDFLSAIENYCNQSENIVRKISLRLAYISTLTDWFEKKDSTSDIVDKVVTLTFESLGVMTEDPTSASPEEEQKTE